MAVRSSTFRAAPRPAGRVPIAGDVVGVSPVRPVQDSMRLSRELGPVYRRKVFGHEMVFVSDPDLVAELVDERRFAKHVSPSIAALRDMAGDGLFTAFNDEPNWQAAHDLLRPAFSQAAMRNYHRIMLEVIGELTSSWDRQPATVDVSAEMTKVTLETIGRTGFSYSFDSFERDDQHPFVAAMVTGLTHSQRTTYRPRLIGDFLYREADRRNRDNVQAVTAMVDDVIAARQQDGAAEVDDLLGLMLATDEAGAAPLSAENVRGQVITFLIAGHETTSGALAFALYYLCADPEVFRRARAEVEAVWGTDPDVDPTFEQVAKLRYVRRVLDEALRLWPTAPAFAREARQDTMLGGRFAMRAGEWVFVLIPMLHRDPVWGGDPDQFDPDRFAPEQVKARPGHVYKPFGTGERACIGRQFAVHEALLVLGSLLRRYDLRADPAYVLQISERLTLMPKGFRVTPVRRESADAAAESSCEGVG